MLSCVCFPVVLLQTRSRSSSAVLHSQSSMEDTKEGPPELKQELDDSSSQPVASKAPPEDISEIKAKREEEERERERREKEREREKEKEKEREREKEKEKEREREKQKQKESEKERESAKDKDKGKHDDGRKKDAELVKQLKADLK